MRPRGAGDSGPPGVLWHLWRKDGHRRTPRHWRGDEPQHAASSDGQALRSPASAPGGSARRPPRLTRRRSTHQSPLPGSSTRRILACPLRIGRHLPPPPRPDGFSVAWCATSTRARVLGWSVAEHIDATLVRGCPRPEPSRSRDLWHVWSSGTPSEGVSPERPSGRGILYPSPHHALHGPNWHLERPYERSSPTRRSSATSTSTATPPATSPSPRRGIERYIQYYNHVRRCSKTRYLVTGPR
jgi:hypothetical protein